MAQSNQTSDSAGTGLSGSINTPVSDDVRRSGRSGFWPAHLRAALTSRNVGQYGDELRHERTQAKIRLINALLVLTYFLVSSQISDFAIDIVHWLFGIGFVVFSLVLLLSSSLRQAVFSPIRRTIGTAGDVGAVTYGMVVTGETGIPLFVLYLFITLGAGFRFGPKTMVLSAAIALVGFICVLLLSPTWQQLPITVPIGVAISLLLLPGYTAHLSQQVARARRRAEEANAAKSRFLARMSHELRTPLNGILGSAELLATSKRLTHEDRSLLDVIKESVQVSIRQIDNVLDFSKIEAGKLIIEHTDFDLHESLNRAVRLVRSAAIEKKLRLTLRIDPSIPYRLVGDPHHLNEVLMNLLSNAVKFTHEGFVALEARLLQKNEEQALLRLSVHDSGIGMDAQATTRIFEAFAQADTGTTRRYGGTGLGTTIAKQLVELMGGQLSVESAKGKGSAFYADIPFVRATDNKHGSQATSLRGLRGLLISNNAVLEKRIAPLLNAWGASIKLVRSTEEAAQALKQGIRLGSPAHVVLADSGIVFTPAGVHRADDFLHKASLSGTRVFLVCDTSPTEAQLRSWGYAWTLAYEAAPEVLHTALRAAKPSDAELHQTGVARVEPWAWTELPAKRPRILIADDNPVNLMVLKRTLEMANYVVDTADEGNAALQLLLANRYKVAVLDMHMPGLDGTEVIKQYRYTQRGTRTFIIVLTANATLDAKIESAEAGADFYLSKPVPADQLLSAVDKAFNETEVYDLSRRRPGVRVAQDDIPILNVDVIGEVNRLFSEPAKLHELVDAFERESRRLLSGFEALLAKQNHGAFWEDVHALKSMSLTVGALRLAQACLELETTGAPSPLERKHVFAHLDALLHDTVAVLRELLATRARAPDSSSGGTQA